MVLREVCQELPLLLVFGHMLQEASVLQAPLIRELREHKTLETNSPYVGYVRAILRDAWPERVISMPGAAGVRPASC